jgi:hypothetical protein
VAGQCRAGVGLVLGRGPDADGAGRSSIRLRRGGQDHSPGQGGSELGRDREPMLGIERMFEGAAKAAQGGSSEVAAEGEKAAHPKAETASAHPAGSAGKMAAAHPERACKESVGARSLIRWGEVRTRVAGWEEPCHPGLTSHAFPTLTHRLPQCNPICTFSPTQPLGATRTRPIRPTGGRWRSAGGSCGRCSDLQTALQIATLHGVLPAPHRPPSRGGALLPRAYPAQASGSVSTSRAPWLVSAAASRPPWLSTTARAILSP